MRCWICSFRRVCESGRAGLAAGEAVEAASSRLLHCDDAKGRGQDSLCKAPSRSLEKFANRSEAHNVENHAFRHAAASPKPFMHA